MSGIVHTPVLLEETLELLGDKSFNISDENLKYGLMIDCTLGEGGHSEAFLTRFSGLKVIGLDADKEIIKIACSRLERFGGRVEFYRLWALDFFKNYSKDLIRPNIILMDLGVSLYHYEKGDRGFSFAKNEALDMRIDIETGVSAAEILEKSNERDLADLIYNNADERYSRHIAKAVVEARRRGKITSSAVLADIVRGAVPPAYRHGRVHPATKTFQALRIAVNGELEYLPRQLDAAFSVLKEGGKLGVISFHSAEDRIVKNFFKEKSIVKEGTLVTKKPAAPSYEEVKRNPASRSAKLRVIEKIIE
ncbi:ribosomal RNA small subunit methyltransferase H [Spirochaetia bacterium]|nr:ribosomal RNA small subunit methyltransferase H [Spirochaetia bacterium]